MLSCTGKSERPLRRSGRLRILLTVRDLHVCPWPVSLKDGGMPDLFRGFELSVAEDAMAVVLKWRVRERQIEAMVKKIREELSSMGVAEIPSDESLERRLREGGGEGETVSITLAEGKWPVPPRDGSIEWARDFFSSGFAVDERTGAIDYWRRADQRGVGEGQLLAEATLAKQGEPGVDVFGKRIPVRRPRRARVRRGPNVRVEEDENVLRFYAETDGRLRWASGLLAVDAVYTIEGDVGLETGYIEHPGSMVVMKDVLSGSRITSSGDVEVMGTVEAAEIETEGSLTVRRGVAGAEGRRIKVGGSFHARFILNVRVEAGEDVVVERDVINSVVKSRGALRMPVGRVAGGEVMALGGIVMGQAGSEGNVPTLLTAGEDFWIADELAKKRERVEEMEKSLQKLRNAAAPLASRRKKQMTPEQKELVTGLLKQISETETTLADVRDEMAKLEEDSRLRRKPEIIVNGTVYPETTFAIGRKSLRVKEGLRGPLRASIVQGKVELLPT